MATTHNPIHCIVPPIILEQIARNGNDRQRERVLSTLTRDHSLRMLRLQNASRPRRHDPLAAAPGGKLQRTIRNAKNTEDLSAPIVRSEGDPASADPAVDEAYDGLGATYQLYWDIYERNSIDDEGLPLDGVVHYGNDYDNAFWNGHQMVFGDGDGELFNRFTISLDVIGHELTHGVTEDEAGLAYLGQSGALNESISDVFGSLVKQHQLQQKADDADWLIGAGLLGPDVQGVALRSMKAPGTAYDDDVLGKDPQPDKMSKYVTTTADSGGVHINSGIPNHAFYMVATTLGAYAWERAGRIWYETLRDPRLRPTARFQTFARTTLRTARRLYGEASDEVDAVKAGWDKVEISV